ncbi:urea transporter [Pseudomonas aeruginosa]|nr:urea transporter [Pseudomonas aeruginosa]
MNRWQGCWSGSACCWSRVPRPPGPSPAPRPALPLAWLLGYDWASALAGLYGLNAALAGLALALRYRSAWPPLLGMGLAVALQPLFGLLGLPALTAPFILACLLCIGGERLTCAWPAASARASAGGAPEQGTLAPAG